MFRICSLYGCFPQSTLLLPRQQTSCTIARASTIYVPYMFLMFFMFPRLQPAAPMSAGLLQIAQAFTMDVTNMFPTWMFRKCSFYGCSPHCTLLLACQQASCTTARDVSYMFTMYTMDVPFIFPVWTFPTVHLAVLMSAGLLHGSKSIHYVCSMYIT